MPSPMIYQDLTTAALLGHAAQYHSETEIVSVSTGGEKERSCWGEVASRAQRLASALASLGLPPGARCATLAWNNQPPSGDLFCRRLRRLGDAHRQSAAVG